MMLGLLGLSITSLLVNHHPVYMAGAASSMKIAFSAQFALPAAVFGDALILGWKNKYNLAFGLGVYSSLNLGILLGYGFYRLGLMMYAQ